MIDSNPRRVLDVATPLWEGEAEVVRTYSTSPSAASRPTFFG
jgi:hypothetical protein